MAVNGKVIINSDVINEITETLEKISSLLANDVIGRLPGNFAALQELDLYSKGIDKIQKQSTDLKTKTDSLKADIESHVEGVYETEDSLSKDLDAGRLPSGSGGYQSNGPVDNHDADDTTDDETEKGKKIHTEIITKVKTLDKSNIENFVELLNQNKGEVELRDLIFDYKHSNEFYKKLSKILGVDIGDGSFLTDELVKEVKKECIQKLFDIEVIPSKLENTSILVAKDYLKLVADKNNVSAGDLFSDDRYKELLQNSLQNLYEGTNVSGFDISDSTVNSFRTYVDGIASDKNMDASAVLADLDILL